MLPHLVWDWNGTLFDDRALLFTAMAQAMREEGFSPASAERMRDEFTRPMKAFFERLVVDLLLKMGYGGSRAEAGRAIGKTGDGGIDGVIDQDQLGLDRIYLQAKKYDPDNAVSEPDIRNFCGSLGANKASKGVFVTTSYFTKPAESFIIN